VASVELSNSSIFNYCTEVYRPLRKPTIPSFDRNTDPYRFRLSIKFTDLPTLVAGRAVGPGGRSVGENRCADGRSMELHGNGSTDSVSFVETVQSSSLASLSATKARFVWVQEVPVRQRLFWKPRLITPAACIRARWPSQTIIMIVMITWDVAKRANKCHLCMLLLIPEFFPGGQRQRLTVNKCILLVQNDSKRASKPIGRPRFVPGPFIYLKALFVAD